MRLYLLPISTRRTLLYCQRLDVATAKQGGIADRVTQKAAKTWADWEKKESGWQKRITEYGNKALKKIPYEEWALKSIPPLSSRRKEEELSGKGKIDIVFPKSVVGQGEVLSLLRTLATERTGLHKSRLVYSIIGMPITIPFMLIPIIPNLPFFYLVYRAWSHWCAFSGAKHIQFLLEKDLLRPVDSITLDKFYAEPLARKKEWTRNLNPDSKDPGDMMLLTTPMARSIAESVKVPELTVELERAVWQVTASLKEAQEAEARKRREQRR